MKAKPLKLWNGRGWTSKWLAGELNPNRVDSYYVAAYSRAHAVRLLNQVIGHTYMSDSELKNYASPMWGSKMDGVTPEVGVWIARDYHSPVIRVL